MRSVFPGIDEQGGVANTAFRGPSDSSTVLQRRWIFVSDKQISAKVPYGLGWNCDDANIKSFIKVRIFRSVSEVLAASAPGYSHFERLPGKRSGHRSEFRRSPNSPQIQPLLVRL